MDGFALCEKLRSKTSLPIVFLSGYTEEESRIRGLTVGGDDYVCKPYSLKELNLRVQARIRADRAAEPPKTLDLALFPLALPPAAQAMVLAAWIFLLMNFVLYFLFDRLFVDAFFVFISGQTACMDEVPYHTSAGQQSYKP